jgi:hypothetical protein
VAAPAVSAAWANTHVHRLHVLRITVHASGLVRLRLCLQLDMRVQLRGMERPCGVRCRIRGKVLVLLVRVHLLLVDVPRLAVRGWRGNERPPIDIGAAGAAVPLRVCICTHDVLLLLQLLLL